LSVRPARRRIAVDAQAVHAVVAVLLFAAITTGRASASAFQGRDDDDGREDEGRDDRGVYAIGLWGDLPYSTTQATVGVPNLIADMNNQDLVFTAHDGDLKAGSNSPCNDALYTQSLAFFNAREAPAIFTLGDNDWTDCDRPSNEYSARNQANILWMQETFAQAKARRSAAIMFISQANPGWDQSDGTRAPLRDPKTLAETDGQLDGFQEFLARRTGLRLSQTW
jgi:hypothetical protein